MDFVKKNLGLLGFALLCVILSGLLVFVIIRSAKAASQYDRKVAEQQKFLTTAESYDYALNDTTLADARGHARQTEEGFAKLRDFLADTYSLPDDPPPTQLECLRALKRQVKDMHTYLKKTVAESEGAQAVYVGQNCTYFSFDDVALAETLPARRDVPAIMRHLAAVWDIVRLVGIAQVTELTQISRPLGLRKLEDDSLYDAIPFEIMVSGTLEQAQRFINLMHTRASYVFFLRSVELLGEDQAPMGTIALLQQFGLSTGSTGGAPGMGNLRGPGAPRPGGAVAPLMPGARPGAGGARPMPPTGGLRGGPMTPGPPGGPMPPGMMPTGPGAPGMPGMPGTGEEAAARPLAGTKSELLAFRRGAVLQAILRFDLIEFKQTEAEEEPDMAFGAEAAPAFEYEE